VDATWLKPIHRVCLLLRYVHGMTLTEIAEQTGRSETQVKGHLQYGRRLLREKYAKVS
jgi:RNA polymerase sigma-70 factor (ECF subfamily)